MLAVTLTVSRRNRELAGRDDATGATQLVFLIRTAVAASKVPDGRGTQIPDLGPRCPFRTHFVPFVASSITFVVNGSVRMLSR
jgi:hypothetical protein